MSWEKEQNDTASENNKSHLSPCHDFSPRQPLQQFFPLQKYQELPKSPRSAFRRLEPLLFVPRISAEQQMDQDKSSVSKSHNSMICMAGTWGTRTGGRRCASPEPPWEDHLSSRFTSNHSNIQSQWKVCTNKLPLSRQCKTLLAYKHKAVIELVVCYQKLFDYQEMLQNREMKNNLNHFRGKFVPAARTWCFVMSECNCHQSLTHEWFWLISRMKSFFWSDVDECCLNRSFRFLFLEICKKRAKSTLTAA